jgi:hypothetical protein
MIKVKNQLMAGKEEASLDSCFVNKGIEYSMRCNEDENC